MHVYGEITGILNTHATLEGQLNLSSGIMPPAYTGDYTVTPTEETQVLDTANFLMTDNVTINPIPSNYGLITWNGVTLTVS